MADLEAAYLRLPVALQHVACSAVGWRTERVRYGGPFPALLAEAESRTFASADEIAAYRDARLRAWIRRCANTVPFYRRRFRDAGIDVRGIGSLDDLAQLPVLTKSEVQDHYPELLSEAVPRRDHRIIHTSGTTGGGLRFATTLRATQEQWAVWWRYRRWHGIERGTWCGYFGGRSVVPLTQTRPPFWRVNVPGRQILFSGYHVSPENLPAYVAELRRRRPPWLHGYPSLLALLATHVVEEDVDLGYEIRWITTGAESMLPQQRAAIERAFGIRPREHYGMAEAVANASECELGTLHVDEDFAAVEFLPTGLGSVYRIVGTNFTNPATPLLRYEIQDHATVESRATCGCGRPGRVVATVDGRREDYVVLANGARIGRMDHVLKDMVNIREAQIHQRRPGAITFRVVRGPSFTEADEDALLREARKRVGEDTEIAVEYVDGLERSRTGKLRFVVSEVPGAEAGGELAA